MKQKVFEDIFVVVVLVSFAFFICMLCPTNIWENVAIETDSGVFRYIAFAMSKGEVIYKDCFDHKGPLIYFLNYLGMSISYYKGIWVVEVLFMLGTVCGIYKIARMFCGKISSCAVVFIVLSSIFAYFEGGNFTEEYAMPLIIWSLYIFLDYFLNEKVSRLRILLCGGMVACVVMLRANMVALWVVFCIAIMLQKFYQKRQKELLGFLGWFLFGCIIVLTPMVLYLCIKGVFGFFIQDYLLFNFTYSVFNKAPKLISYIVFVDSYWMLASLGIIFYAFATVADRKKKYVYGVYFLFIVCSILLTCMSGNDYGHYGMTLIPTFILPAALLLGYVEGRAEENKLWYFMIYCCMILLLPPWVEELKNTVYAHYYGEFFYRGEDLELAIDAVLSNSTEEDRITVWGTLDSIYVYTGRLSASRYSYQFPLALVKPEIYDEYFEDLEEHLPRLVVTDYYSTMLDASRMQDFLELHNYGMILDAGDLRVYSVQ